MKKRAKADTKLRDEARSYLRALKKSLRRAKIEDHIRHRLQKSGESVREALSKKDDNLLRERFGELKGSVGDTELTVKPKSSGREFLESIALAFFIALILRGFVVQAFKIPTGSMIPTLLVGDRLFVNKLSYGIRVPIAGTYLWERRQPERGEVVVFTFPSAQAREHIQEQPVSFRDCIDRASLEHEKDFIKRIIGLPGDTVEIRQDRLFVNDQEVPRTFESREKTGVFMFPDIVLEREELGEYSYRIQHMENRRNFGPIKVRDGNFFAVGDNRDNSSDSRCWGQVPIQNIKGKAMFVFFSWGDQGILFRRIGHRIHSPV